MEQRDRPLTQADRRLVQRLNQTTSAVDELCGDAIIDTELNLAIAARAKRLEDLIYADAATSRLGGRRSHLLREETARFCTALAELVDVAVDHQVASLISDDLLPLTLTDLWQRLSAESVAHDELRGIV